jgi:hypothetical protein
VLTHSHPLDYRLCRAILARGDFAWLGPDRLEEQGRALSFAPERAMACRPSAIARLVCPIGLAGIEQMAGGDCGRPSPLSSCRDQCCAGAEHAGVVAREPTPRCRAMLPRCPKAACAVTRHATQRW